MNNMEVDMLILSRKSGESLLIEPDPTAGGDPKDWFADGPIRVRINDVRHNLVRIGIKAPQTLRILREELIAGSRRNDPVATSPREALARKVRLLRAVRRWSTHELAQATGLSLTVVACIESAGGNVGSVELEALARVFGLTVAELFLPPGHTPEERRLMAALANGR